MNANKKVIVIIVTIVAVAVAVIVGVKTLGGGPAKVDPAAIQQDIKRATQQHVTDPSKLPPVTQQPNTMANMLPGNKGRGAAGR